MARTKYNYFYSVVLFWKPVILEKKVYLKIICIGRLFYNLFLHVGVNFWLPNFFSANFKQIIFSANFIFGSEICISWPDCPYVCLIFSINRIKLSWSNFHLFLLHFWKKGMNILDHSTISFCWEIEMFIEKLNVIGNSVIISNPGY